MTTETTERIVLVTEPEEDFWRLVQDPSGAPRVFRGTKSSAIDEAYELLGGDDRLKPGGELAFRAPSLRSWKGERVIRVPDAPKPERLWRD